MAQSRKDDITDVLKKLISGEKSKPLLLYNSASGEKDLGDVVRSKNVVMFVSNLDITPGIISKMEGICKKLKMTDPVKIWLPVVRWTDELEDRYRELWATMKCWYTVQYYSRLAGAKLILEWDFKVPFVQVMNSKGDEIEKIEVKLPEPKPPLLYPRPLASLEGKEPYTLLYGSKYTYWNERFSRIAAVVKGDNIIRAKNIDIKLIHVVKDLRLNEGNCDKEYADYLSPFRRKHKWALLLKKGKNQKEKIREGPKILNVLEAVQSWKEDVTLKSFGFCVQEYYDELS